MKLITSLALIAALAACDQHQSRLDKVANQTPPASGTEAPAARGKGPPAGLKIDRTGSLEQQVARLQDAHDKNAEAMDFLGKVYGQQKAQQEAAERDEPAEDAMFAVNVADDVRAGQVEGPASAGVTIVEAWDFA
ncbi:MAG TPA: hypothetical protein VIX73_07755 [Kofleriaceae bacterium]|jgi:hypothetical protein